MIIKDPAIRKLVDANLIHVQFPEEPPEEYTMNCFFYIGPDGQRKESTGVLGITANATC